MAKIIKLPNSIEKVNNLTETNRENLTILKLIDESSFDKLAKGFSSEKDQNKVVLSGFLNSTNVTIEQLGSIKIDINHIKDFIRNKPDISKNLEKKIAKLYLKKLYDSCVEDDALISELNNVFNIHSEKLENKLEKQKLKKLINDLDPSQVPFFLKHHNITLKDLEDNEDDKNENILKEIKAIIDNDKGNIDFKKIQIDVNKLGNARNDKLNSIVITNDEIFNLIPEINKICNFESQKPSSQGIILDILQFEMKNILRNNQLRGENIAKDMEDSVSPATSIPEMFDKIKNPDVEKLSMQKGKLEEFLFMGEVRLKETEKTVLKEKIGELEGAGFDDEFISKLKKLLLGKIDYPLVKKFLKRKIEIINKQIWKEYIENFEKSGEDEKFLTIIKKLYSNEFDFSKLEKNEQSILWQSIMLNKFDKKENLWMKHIGLNQEDFKSFLKDLYDFEKDEIAIDINDVGSLKLHITKELEGGENKEFLDINSFKNMDATNPVKFTVNLDGNDEDLIKDLEETKDSPLRLNGIMETHATRGGELNIGNGYILEICGKKITKDQLDELLLCKELPELNEKLKDFGLFEELKDEVNSTRKEIYHPQNIYSNLDEDGFDSGQGDNNLTISYSDKVCIFEEVLKKLDVKVVERNLIFKGKDIDKLSQIYVMAKTGGMRDRKLNKLLDASYDPEEELGDAESGKAKAEVIWNTIKLWYNDEYRDADDEENNFEEFSFEGSGIEEDVENYWNKLDDEGKKAFKERLRELCKNDPDIEYNDKNDISDEIDRLIYELEHPSSAATVSDDLPENLTQPEKTPEESFQETWESLSGDKECKEMTKGMRLYFDLGESQLPPKDITDSEKSFYCFEIVDVGETTFTLKAIGGDLKSSLTGKEYVLEKDQLESMKKGGSIYRVRADNTRDWSSCLESINKAGFFKKFTTFGNMEGQVKMEGNKFVNEKGEEIKYFDRIEGVFDDSNPDKGKWGQGQKIYKYEIKKIDTSKGTVKLASKFDSHDENYNDIVCEYENEIPFEQFILLMEGKRLKGYTQEQQNEMETKYDITDPKRLATKGMRKWISIGAMINVFKNTGKAIKAKIDERNKQGEEDFENWLLSDEGFNLYGKLSPLLGDSAKKLQYDFYTNRENRTWKRIEERYKIFESDPNYSELFNEHLQHILAREGDISNDKDRYKFAAAFLIMVKKEGPYPRVFANQKDTGKRVYNLLGKDHRDRFLSFYNQKKKELSQEKDMGHQSGARLALQEELNKMEIQYIVSTIDGRAPYGPNSNEFMLKSIWGLKFMSTLEENAKGYYNKHEEEKNSLETFYAAEEAYLRNLGSGKFQKALPALERMCETAKTPGEVFRIKGYILGAMLMGIIKNNSSAKTIKSFWGTCRSMGFAPGYWMRDIEQQDKIKILLDGVTNGEFSKNPNLKYKVSDFEPGNIKDGKYGFGKLFQGYRNSHGKDILKKIENPTYKNGAGDKSIVDLANEKDNPNNYVFNDIIKNSTTNEIDQMGNVNPIFAQESPLSATSNMVKDYIPQNGKYSKLKSEEDISNAEDFRTKTNEAIPNSSEKSDKTTVDFMFKKFFNRFDRDITTNIQKMVTRALPLIQKEKEKHHENNAKYMLWYMLKGNMHESTRGAFPPEFEQVMDKFVEFFFTNIDLIDKGTIKSTFDADVASNYDNPYVMLDWKQYRGYCMQTATGGRNKNKYKKLIRVELNKLGKEESDTINDSIGDIRNKIRHYSGPDVQPDNILNYNNSNGIWVDMSKTDKEVTEEENKYIYGMAA